MRELYVTVFTRETAVNLNSLNYVPDTRIRSADTTRCTDDHPANRLRRTIIPVGR